jgi:hypothetical protein
MRSTRRNHRKALKVLALGLATSAVVAGTASAQVRDSGIVANKSEISYLSWGQALTEGQGGVTPTNLARAYVPQGGVTPTNLARAYAPRIEGVSNPDGFQPQLRGEQPLVIRDKPDGFQPQTKHADVVSVSAGSSGLDSGDLALGFGLGLILATAAAIALAMVRDRERMAHS